MNTNKILSLMLVLVTLLTASCQVDRFNSDALNSSRSQLKQYSLEITDLPHGWKFSERSWGTDFGGESYAVTYKLNDLIHISHDTDIYSDEDQSKIGYQKWEADWFNSTTKPWPGATFSPSDQSDQSRFECLQLSPMDPLLSCAYLQRHKKIISFVLVTIDNSDFTFTELNSILDILDKRLNEVVLDAKPEGNTP